MPIKTSDVPFLREPTVPESKTESEPKPAKGSLGAAATSGDPAVHKLLADRQGHTSNLEQASVDLSEQKKAAQAAIDEIDKQLAELGYTAK